MSPLHEEVVMGYIGGGLHRSFVERVRGVEPERLLAVPIDVGKRAAAALVCDFWGEVYQPCSIWRFCARVPRRSTSCGPPVTRRARAASWPTGPPRNPYCTTWTILLRP